MASSLKSADWSLIIFIGSHLDFSMPTQSMNYYWKVNPNPGKEDSDSPIRHHLIWDGLPGTSALSGPIRNRSRLSKEKKLSRAISQKGKFPGGGISPRKWSKEKCAILFGPYNFVRDFGLKSVDDYLRIHSLFWTGKMEPRSLKQIHWAAD